MNIIYENNKIRRLCEKATGKLQRRLDDMLDAENLKVLMTLPGRCHPLKADRKGEWAIDVDQPKRLIFELADDPLPISPDGWVDMEKVKSVRLLEVRDYHGK